MAFTTAKSVLNYTAGRWRENILFEESLINESLQKGILWDSTCYMLYFSWIKIGRGEFSDCEIYISKLFDIGDTYDYDAATLYAHVLKVFAANSKGCISVVQSAADEGIAFCIKHGLKLHQIAITSWKAEAQVLSGDLESAKASLFQAKELFDQQKLLAPGYAVPYLAARFMFDICILRRSMDTDHKYAPGIQKSAIKDRKAVLSILKRYPPDQTKVYRLMGEYNWLTGKQKKALKWWDKSIKTGEAMGAWPDLSRTYFEVGQRLLEPDSKYRELNGITAEEYLDKARTMFVEMKLQWDLDELDKLMAAREGII
jgi:tetratricopeptide (TPR) repeat protein